MYINLLNVLTWLVHRSGSCGAIVDPGSADSWVCELCENEETQEASIVSSFLFIDIDII